MSYPDATWLEYITVGLVVLVALMGAVFLGLRIWAHLQGEPPPHDRFATKREVKAVEDKVNKFESKIDDGFKEIERSGKFSRSELYKSINGTREDVASLKEKAEGTERHLFRLEGKLDRLIENKSST